MLNIKELTQHVTTADRSRYQSGRTHRALHNDYIPVTIGGQTVTVHSAVLSRIAKKAPTVEAEIVRREPVVIQHYDYPEGPFNPGVFSHEEVTERYALRLTKGATVWVLYDYTGAK